MRGLTQERVRRDVDAIARGGLDLPTFVEELTASLRRAVPFAGACCSAVDPATNLTTATFKFGELAGRDEHDEAWAQIEYLGGDPTGFVELLRRPSAAVGMHVETDGDVTRSVRMREYMLPRFGFGDELRVAGRAGGAMWGGLALLRHEGEPAFSPEEVAFVEALGATFTLGLRAGLLARCAAPTVNIDQRGPAVIVVREGGDVVQSSVGADEWLAELHAVDNSSGPTTTLAVLVAGARRYALGESGVLPRCRVRVPSGRWLVLHASPLAGPAGTTGDVVVTIEEARPPEIVPLVVAAFELTPREREVTQLVLQGVETKEIAAQLGMSSYTVQDHLKSVFEKAGVRSRRELTARVFFDQYVPRIGGELAPSGWFLPTSEA